MFGGNGRDGNRRGGSRDPILRYSGLRRWRYEIARLDYE